MSMCVHARKAVCTCVILLGTSFLFSFPQFRFAKYLTIAQSWKGLGVAKTA